MVAAACDTNVFHVNAAVNYGYVCVFINGHYYCGVNYFSYFYGNCVVAVSVNFQSSNCACFSGSSFHFQTCDFQNVCATNNITDVQYDFIVFEAVDSRVTYAEFQVCLFACEFKTVAQFQFQFTVCFDDRANVVANSGFNLQFFQFNHFFRSNINSIFYRSFDAFAFNGSVCQIGTVGDCDIIGFNSYFCLFAFCCFVHNGSQVKGQNGASVHFTVDYNFYFVVICKFYRCDFYFVAIVIHICEFNIFVAFASLFCYCFVAFQCDRQCALVSDCAAGFVEIRVIQRQSVFHCCIGSGSVVSCCECQLCFGAGYFFVNFAGLDLVLCVVLGTYNLSCCFYVAGSRKCSCGNQGYDHSRSHHHGKKLLHGSFLLLSRLFISFSFHNYTTNLPLVCTASLPSATGKNGTLGTAVHSPIPQRASDSLVQSSSVPKRYRESTDFVCKFIILMHSIFGKRKFRM